jgi:hypothetical protein
MIVIPMIIGGFRKAKNTKPYQNQNPSNQTQTRARIPLSSTQHIGNMSEFFKNPGKSCGSCGKGRK